MEWKKLRVGSVLWYVFERSDPIYGQIVELWRGVVQEIGPNEWYPVKCRWNRVGGCSEYTNIPFKWMPQIVSPDNKAEWGKNPTVFETADEAIEEYLNRLDKHLRKQAFELKAHCNHKLKLVYDHY